MDKNIKNTAQYLVNNAIKKWLSSSKLNEGEYLAGGYHYNNLELEMEINKEDVIQLKDMKKYFKKMISDGLIDCEGGDKYTFLEKITFREKIERNLKKEIIAYSQKGKDYFNARNEDEYNGYLKKYCDTDVKSMNFDIDINSEKYLARQLVERAIRRTLGEDNKLVTNLDFYKLNEDLVQEDIKLNEKLYYCKYVEGSEAEKYLESEFADKIEEIKNNEKYKTIDIDKYVDDIKEQVNIELLNYNTINNSNNGIEIPRISGLTYLTSVTTEYLNENDKVAEIEKLDIFKDSENKIVTKSSLPPQAMSQYGENVNIENIRESIERENELNHAVTDFTNLENYIKKNSISKEFLDILPTNRQEPKNIVQNINEREL